MGEFIGFIYLLEFIDTEKNNALSQHHFGEDSFQLMMKSINLRDYK